MQQCQWYVGLVVDVVVVCVEVKLELWHLIANQVPQQWIFVKVLVGALFWNGWQLWLGLCGMLQKQW